MDINPNSEGFVLLYDGVTGHAMLGDNMQRRLHSVEDLDSAKHAMGYMAYPNAGLKNDIPDFKFYECENILETDHLELGNAGEYSTSGEIEQSDSKEEYLEKMKKIKSLLEEGEIYQINYAIRFRKQFSGDPFALFTKLMKINPTEFAAYLNCGDFQIISASPERFFKVENGKIKTEPIKGTISKEGGKENLELLLNSEKERAELDMITDLERNDVGKIAKYGTLEVTENRAIKELSNLWHAYSVVEAEVDDKKPSEVIAAMFPGGSITGCPKKRSMKYIGELEELPRNIFTGSIGYVKEGNIDFNIAIRTILIKDGMLELWAGGGIVYDSDPEKEYDEILLKAEKLLSLL